MADDYEIVARIVVKDHSGRPTAGAKRNLRGVETQARRTGSAISSILRRVSMLAGAAGIGLATRSVIGFHTEIENATSGIAGMINAVTGTPIARAMQMARGEVDLLRKDAAKGMGSFQDYLQGFNQMFQPMVALGANGADVRRMTQMAITAGYASGRGAEGARLAGLDVYQALTAGVGDRTTPVANQALRTIGVSNEQFNAMAPIKRLKTLEKAFGSYGEAAKLFGNTWDAQWDTFKDNARELLRSASRPIFDRWRQGLIKLNGWIERNAGRLDETAGRIGNRLLQLWDQLIRQAKIYASIVAGATLATAAPGAAAAARPMLTGAAIASGLGPKAGALAFLRGLGSIITKVAAPVAIATAVFMGLFGALEEFPMAGAIVAQAWAAIVNQMTLLGDSFAMVTAKGSALNLAGLGLIGIFTGLLKVVKVGIQIVSSLVTGFGLVFRMLGTGVTGLVKLASGDKSGAKAAFNQTIAATFQAQKQLKTIWNGLPEPPKLPGEGSDEFPNGRPKSQTNNYFTGPITVKMDVEANADPGRVAYVVSDMIERLGRAPVQARRLAHGVK